MQQDLQQVIVPFCYSPLFAQAESFADWIANRWHKRFCKRFCNTEHILAALVMAALACNLTVTQLLSKSQCLGGSMLFDVCRSAQAACAPMSIPHCSHFFFLLHSDQHRLHRLQKPLVRCRSISCLTPRCWLAPRAPCPTAPPGSGRGPPATGTNHRPASCAACDENRVYVRGRSVMCLPVQTSCQERAPTHQHARAGLPALRGQAGQRLEIIGGQAPGGSLEVGPAGKGSGNARGARNRRRCAGCLAAGSASKHFKDLAWRLS